MRHGQGMRLDGIIRTVSCSAADFNRLSGHQTVAEGTDATVAPATISQDGPTGDFRNALAESQIDPIPASIGLVRLRPIVRSLRLTSSRPLCVGSSATHLCL
jgi:hypothetical protein